VKVCSDRQVEMSVKGHVKTKKRELQHQNNDATVGSFSLYKRASIRNILTAEQSSESPCNALMLNADTGLLLCLYPHRAEALSDAFV